MRQATLSLSNSKQVLERSMTNSAPRVPLFEVIENARVSALKSYNVLDSGAASDFDQVTEFAAQSLRAPIALISFIDRNRQWVKSSVGLHVIEVPRHLSFCHHTLATETGTLVIEDMSADVRFSRHPLVHGAPFIRFYAGMTLIDREGYRLGTISVMDRRPHNFDVASCELLRQVAIQIVDLLVLHRASTARVLEATLHDLQQAIADPEIVKAQIQFGACTMPRVPMDLAAQQAQLQRFTTPHSTVSVETEVPLSGQGWLGVRTELARPLLGSGEVGRLVVRIARNSPAERAGLQIGDVLLSIDQKSTRRSNDIVTAMRSRVIGERAELRLWRSGKEVQKAVVVEAALFSHPRYPTISSHPERIVVGL